MQDPRPNVKGNRIFWKLSAAFLAIILLVILASSIVNGFVEERYALWAAREGTEFNSKVIHHALREFMMTRDITGIRRLIEEVSIGNPVYREVRLISHTGEVVVGARADDEIIVKEESRPCNICHSAKGFPQPLVDCTFDEIARAPNGDRIVSVIAPILNEESCRSAQCHAHADSPPVLGVLQTDLSLREVDAFLSLRHYQMALAVIVAVLLCIVTTWFIVSRLLERPIRTLIAGIRRIGGGDLSFRFQSGRNDEIGLLADAFDEMTERLEESHTELARTRDYLEGMVESSADIIITVNPVGLIQTFNRGAEQALGYGRDEVIGKRIEMLFANPRERDIAIERLKYSDNVVNYETHFLTRRGEVRDVIVTLSRLRDRDGTPIGTFGISKDVTREKELQQQVLQAERFTAIGQAFTGVLHAMKNMLNALKGGAYMVKTAIAKDDREMLEDGWRIVQEGITSVTDMSMDMLKYVRETKPEHKLCDLGRLIDEVAAVVKQTASDRGVRFSVNTATTTPRILCDSKLIHSAIMDLVSNALDACDDRNGKGDESPEIAVSLFPLENSKKVAIEVRDNGIGMTEEVQANVFTPFFSTKKKAGTGLGLALTARVVGVHNGRISVESEPGGCVPIVVEKRDALLTPRS